MGGLFGGGGGETTYIEGNRISEFMVNMCVYGNAVPVVFGTVRLSGNVIDWTEFTEHAHTEVREQSVGKRGKNRIVTTTYTYTVKVAIALCEGEINSVMRVWNGTDITGLTALGLNLFTGTANQSPWEGFSGDHALPYSRLSYVAGTLDLGNSGSLPNLNFEVAGLLLSSGDGVDANPADVIEYIVTNDISGLGYDSSNIDATSLANYRRYCQAANLYISLPDDVQDTGAVNIINDILTATLSIGIWSDKKLKIIPMAEESISGNGVTWNPNMTPVYNLTDDDFCPAKGKPAVDFTRADNSECYNEVSIEFINRANSYEKEVAKFQILSDISKRGLIPAAKKTMHFLHTKDRALYVAEQLATRSAYARNKYTFRLDWSYCALEPGDLVTISNEKLGLVNTLVRISTTDEDEDGMLSITAVAVRTGSAATIAYPQDPPRQTINTNVDPGDVEAPLIFELPYQTNQREVGMAICGLQPKWGGAQIWLSFDNEAYEYAGEVWAPSRYGEITTGLASDGTSVGIELVYKRRQMQNVTETAAEAGDVICRVGDEWITYENAELISEGVYTLSGITRGLYGTGSDAHSAGERFAVVDSAIFKHTFRIEDTGRLVYIKLLSFNVYGKNVQPIDEVTAYEYTIQGPTPLNEVTNLAAVGAFRSVKVSWDAPDGNADVAGYEIWCSTETNSFADAVKAGETRDISFLHEGLGIMQTVWYWVCAYDAGNNKGTYTGPVSAMTKALEMDDIPDQSIPPSKFLPSLERLIDDVKKVSAAGVVNAIVTDANRHKAAVATQELNTRVVEGLSAEATARTTLAARLDQADATLAASLQDEQAARVTADEAEATARTTLAAQVNDNVAAIQSNVSAIATVDGKVEAQVSLVLNANGKIVGFIMGTDGDTGEAVFLADKFKIAKADGSNQQIFEVNTATGLVQILGSLIASGSITGDKINAATRIQLGQDGELIIGDGGVIQIGSTIVIDSGSGSFF